MNPLNLNDIDDANEVKFLQKIKKTFVLLARSFQNHEREYEFQRENEQRQEIVNGIEKLIEKETETLTFYQILLLAKQVEAFIK